MARSQTTPVSNLTLKLKLSAEDKKKLRNRMSGPVGSTSSSIKEETATELAGLPELNAMAQKEAGLA
ncbi:hypothetical protein HDU99_006592 [Rhizoclosmatium hyalinum]|nr:hypothetical protein HDU99_006592 [Rhizoclosmatium hyalinum]